MALGALHEVAGGANGALDGAAAALFAAGILARTHGPVLWCLSRRDLFAPAMAQAGLHPDRVIYAEAGSEKAILACFEEGLRHGGLAGVVARSRQAAHDAVAAPATGCGGYRHDRHRDPALATTDRSGGFRTADGQHDPLAGDGPALVTAFGARGGTAAMAGGVDPGARRGMRGF